jgi:CheY-like chemotaxis protein
VAFRRLGQFELVHATNGLEGLHTLDSHPDVDLILLDINMPIMDGLAFLEQLRMIPGHRNTFVIVASTEREDGKIRDALTRGAQAFLKKPFTLEQLLELLQRVLPLVPARSARWAP